MTFQYCHGGFRGEIILPLWQYVESRKKCARRKSDLSSPRRSGGGLSQLSHITYIDNRTSITTTATILSL